MDQCSERLGDLFWRVSSRHCASASHRQFGPTPECFVQRQKPPAFENTGREKSDLTLGSAPLRESMGVGGNGIGPASAGQTVDETEKASGGNNTDACRQRTLMQSAPCGERGCWLTVRYRDAAERLLIAFCRWIPTGTPRCDPLWLSPKLNPGHCWGFSVWF
jgi:hypothetical protein